jgi:hypothetical protein
VRDLLWSCPKSSGLAVVEYLASAAVDGRRANLVAVVEVVVVEVASERRRMLGRVS